MMGFMLLICSYALGNAAIDTDNSNFNNRDQITRQIVAENGKSKQDIEITRQIRKSIVDDKSLSAYAQNVQVVTTDGEVTLKGLVKSVREQRVIVQKAQSVSGVTTVYNQTDVTTK